MDELIIRAYAAGADEACLIPANQVPINPDLAKLCREPRCADYGQAPGCPPYCSGPAGFRLLRQSSREALVLRIQGPESDLMTSRSNAVMKRLQSLAANLEEEALRLGYQHAQAYAGGSCKRIFCHEDDECPVIAGTGPCRYPHQARPSMSGFGIDLLALMDICGWPAQFIDLKKEASATRQSWVAALVLLGPRQPKKLSCLESVLGADSGEKFR